MNGYQKMKRLRSMRVIKIVSSVTALSMAVTSLVIAASADEANADKIALALGELTNYGVVADTFQATGSHFEVNYAVNNLVITNRYSASQYVDKAIRTVNLNVSTEASGESEYYYGIYVYGTGEQVNVGYTNNDGVTVSSGVLVVPFSGKGTKSFVVSIPNEYKYKDLIVHELVKDEETRTYKICEGDAGTILKAGAASAEEMKKLVNTSLIAETMQADSFVFGDDKTLYVGSAIYSGITGPNNDGRYLYNGREISERGTEVYLLSDNGRVNGMMANIQKTSDLIAGFNAVSAGDKILLSKFTGSISPNSGDPNSPDSRISEAYKFMESHPDYIMVVNIVLPENGNYRYQFTHKVDSWDVAVASRIVFNFTGNTDPDKTTVYLEAGFAGTVVAPNATVQNLGTIIGAIYAPKVELGNGEIHLATYRFGAMLGEYFSGHQDGNVTTTEATTPEETTPEEITTENTTAEEVTTTPEQTTTTVVEETTTTPPQTTAVTTSETTVTKPEETTTAATTTTAAVTTTTTAATTTPPVTTTTPQVTTPPTTTTTPEVTTTTTTTAATTPVTTTATTPATTTTPVTTTTTPITTTAPVATTTAATTTTTTTTTTTPPPPSETTSATAETGEIVTTTPPVTTTTASVVTTANVTTTPSETTVTTDDVITVVNTTTPEESTDDISEVSTTAVTTPEETTTTTPPPVTTTMVVTIPDEDVPRDELIIIDEEIPLGDLPNTGVNNDMTLFLIIGGAALVLGVGAQVCTVIIKRKK